MMRQKLKLQPTKGNRRHFNAAKKVAKILRKNNFDAYIIGGAVRDMYLGIIPTDFDLVTNATPEQLKSIRNLRIVDYGDSAEKFGISRVKTSSGRLAGKSTVIIEVATYRQDIEAHLGRKRTQIKFAKLKDDVLRRDFTVNALAYDPLSSEIVDLVGGLEDLRSKLLRFIGQPEQRIQEDPLRILRGVRLKNQLSLIYEVATVRAIKNSALENIIENSAIERIRSELTKMFKHPSRREALLDLDELGLLQKLLPEVYAMKGIDQPPSLHAEGTVWSHTLLSMHFLPADASSELVWATLLHDVGKPPTAMPVSKTGDRIRFSDHYKVGAQISENILRRFNFSNEFIANVSWLVYNHLNIDNLPKMTSGHRKTMLSHSSFGNLLELHRADAHASWSPTESGLIDTGPAHFKEIENLWSDYKQLVKKSPPKSIKSEFGIDGHWLKANYNLSGKKLGYVKDKLELSFKNDEIRTIDEAKKFIENQLG